MLFCETSKADAARFDDLAVLMSQLRAAGHEACLGTASVPGELGRSHLFDILPHVRKEPPGSGDTLLLLRGHEIDDRALARLRRLALPEGLRTIVWGAFPTFQAEIGTRVKLSYVLGDSPEIHAMPAGLSAGRHHLPVFGVRAERAPRRDARPTLLLVGPSLDAEPQAQALLALACSSAFRLVVLTDGQAKQSWAERFGHEVTVYHHGEILPTAAASLADLALLFAPPASSYRSEALLANLAVRGVPLIDCSPGWAHQKNAGCMLQGPSDLGALATFLSGGILASAPMIGREVARSRFAAALDAQEVLAHLAPGPAGAAPLPRPALVAATAPGQAPAAEGPSPAVTFVPTNGVGLGHAQRCSLIAAELGQEGLRPAFAAFPSCMRMLKSYGFDVMPLVGRSAFHKQEHENDLVNYMRLRRLTAGGDALVFDGGYVFDSIYRSVLENRLSGVWIRRGLWQEGQSNTVALDREKVFRRVIVPEEAFEELNSPYSQGGHVRAVGPIVQRVGLTETAREALRDDLRVRFGIDFRHLAVTMLGGGVAADRSAQVAAACALMAARPDTLHLVVVWPTATVEAGAFTWPNTRIVKTHHASVLVAAADLYLSAVGYNSFHEVLYNGVPTIFMPQMSAFMDDQRRRAGAAVERGLSDMVEANEMHSLRRKVSDLLDGARGAEMRERLRALDLPQPGNSEAARLIMEIAECARPAGKPSSPESPETSLRTSTTSSVPSTAGAPIPDAICSLRRSA